MEIVGEQIKLARLLRNLSMAQVAESATCSEVTLCKVEKGLPTVSIGIYLRVLYALQLDDDILLLSLIHICSLFLMQPMVPSLITSAEVEVRR